MQATITYARHLYTLRCSQLRNMLPGLTAVFMLQFY